jgi:hypothetical protein
MLRARLQMWSVLHRVTQRLPVRVIGYAVLGMPAIALALVVFAVSR